MAGAMKVLVKSPYSIYSGYGQDGYGLARALVRWGADVYLQPTWLDVPVPRDLLHLLAKPLVTPFDLTINHWDPTSLGIDETARKATSLAVAWTMWEFGPPPGNPGRGGLYPIARNRSTFTKRMKWYDLLLAYDPVSLAALEPLLPAHVARGVLIGGYDSGNWQPVERDWFGDQFGFAMHGALNNRKQPMLVLQAHQMLRAEHEDYRRQARLSFHTTIPPLFPELNDILGNQRVRVYYDTWDDATLKAFYAAQHCLVYPSQGEGKNVPALEFMSTGGTVIHTKRGGPEHWLGEHVGYEVPFELRPVLPRFPDGCHSARVSAGDLADVMLEVFRNRGEARKRGDYAAKLIPSQLDWAVVCEDLFRRCRDLCGRHGEIIYQMAHECRRTEPDLRPSSRGE